MKHSLSLRRRRRQPPAVSDPDTRRRRVPARRAAAAAAPPDSALAAARLERRRSACATPTLTSSRSINRFRRYIDRQHARSGASTPARMWSEGPAWNGVGRYLVWSDIPNNVQLRWVEDDGRVTRVPQPVGLQQRQHLRLRGPPALLRARRTPRRPLRARRARSPSSPSASRASASTRRTTSSSTPIGSIWFTDPLYGIRGNYEGFKAESETKPAIYRVDPPPARWR